MGNRNMEKRDIINTLKVRFNALPGLPGPMREYGRKAWSFLLTNPASDLVSPPTCIALSLEPGRVAVFSATRSFSRYRVLAARSYPLEGKEYPSPDELASVFEIARTELGLGTADVILCLPKPWVIFQSATLPAVVAENLPQVVEYEFDRFMPFGADDAAFDFIADPSTPDMIQISLAACRSQIVSGYVAALAQSGGTVSRVAVDLSALASISRFLSGHESFLFACLDGMVIRGGLVENALLKTGFSQAIPGAAAHAPDAPGALQALLDAVRPEGKDIPVVVSFGNDAAGLREQIEHQQDIRVQVLDTAGTPFPGTEALGQAGLIAAGSTLECLWPKAAGLNLLARGVRTPDRPPFLVSFVLLAALLICVGIYLLMPLRIEEQRLKEIDRQIALRKDQVRSVEAIIKEMEDINKEQAQIAAFRHAKPLAIDLLRELTTIIPKNAWLSRVRIAGNQMNLEGYSPSASGLIEILEASKYFQKVEFASPTFRDARQNMDRFQIKMEIEGIVPEEKDREKK